MTSLYVRLWENYICFLGVRLSLPRNLVYHCGFMIVQGLILQCSAVPCIVVRPP